MFWLTRERQTPLNETLSSIHKQAGYKTKRNFYDRSSWPWKGNYISLYAKDTGRANQENKYELPPPVDSDLYFNNMVLIKHSDLTPCQEDLLDLTIEEWKQCYNKLYGGFEDLGQEDSYSSEEDIPVELQTKHGYSKEGGFVVDSDDEDDEDWVPSGEEKPSEEEEEWIPSDEEGDEEEGQEGDEEEEQLLLTLIRQEILKLRNDRIREEREEEKRRLREKRRQRKEILQVLSIIGITVGTVLACSLITFFIIKVLVK